MDHMLLMGLFRKMEVTCRHLGPGAILSNKELDLET